PGTGCQPGSERYQAQVGYVHAIMRAVEVIAHEERQTGGTVALVGPEKMIKHAEATWREWGTRPAGLVTGHFGALRGLNSMERVSRLISIGRPLPPLTEVESQCRAVFGRQPATL